jgi:pimeloyl-ACP methyl ester carboxylesterase
VDAVFLHANGFNAWTYRQILAPLGGDFRLLAVDQRGHGCTTLEAEPRGRTDWLDLRDDLLAFLGALDLADVVLAGHSMGGTVSILAAAAQAGRVRSLALFDPVIKPQGAATVVEDSPMVLAAQRRRAVFASRDEAMASYRGRGAFRTWPEAILADYVASGFRDLPGGEVTLACTPRWEASGFSAAHGHDAWRALCAVRRPVRLLRAETGSTCRLQTVPASAQGSVQVATVADSTHFLPMDQPDVVRQTLREAIGRVGV